MIEKKIKSKLDFVLNTGIEEYRLSVDEVRTVAFKNGSVLNDLLTFGQFEVVPSTTVEQKPIMVLYPPSSSIPEPSRICVTPSANAFDQPLESGVDELLARMRAKQ